MYEKFFGQLVSTCKACFTKIMHIRSHLSEMCLLIMMYSAMWVLWSPPCLQPAHLLVTRSVFTNESLSLCSPIDDVMVITFGLEETLLPTFWSSYFKVSVRVWALFILLWTSLLCENEIYDITNIWGQSHVWHCLWSCESQSLLRAVLWLLNMNVCNRKWQFPCAFIGH